jgi:hypothetical protein
MNDLSYHPSLNKQHPELLTKDIIELKNIIFYGKRGVGKYYQSIECIKQYSPSLLKYNKKMFINDDYYIKISDIHFEVDMSTLGCNFKTLWDMIQKQIKNSMESNKLEKAIILCKHFHLTNNELVSNFKNLMMKNIIYIINTEHVGFIPNDIISRFHIVPMRRVMKKIINRKHYSDNLKILHMPVLKQYNNIEYIDNKYINNIIDYLEKNKTTFEFKVLREHIYNLLVFQCDIDDAIWKLYSHFSTNIKESDTISIINEIYKFFKLFNNNYRPIFHLEKIILFIFQKVN